MFLWFLFCFQIIKELLAQPEISLAFLPLFSSLMYICLCTFGNKKYSLANGNIFKLHDQIIWNVSYSISVLTRTAFLNKLLNVLLCFFRLRKSKTEFEVYTQRWKASHGTDDVRNSKRFSFQQTNALKLANLFENFWGCLHKQSALLPLFWSGQYKST